MTALRAMISYCDVCPATDFLDILVHLVPALRTRMLVVENFASIGIEEAD
jgi:hypothetical protein